MTKTIKVGDLTLNELIRMKCPAPKCIKCPFGNYKKDFLSDRLCDIVNTFDELNIMNKEIKVNIKDIEVEYDESK